MFHLSKTDTSARFLKARPLTSEYQKSWQNCWLAEKLLHSPDRILKSSGVYWHTDVFILKDILDHSVNIHFIIYWFIFVNLFNSLIYFKIIHLFVLKFYLILYMSICFTTLQMERLELNIPLISTCLQDQECPPLNMSAYHGDNGHHACRICKSTLMHAQTAEKQYHISHPWTVVRP